MIADVHVGRQMRVDIHKGRTNPQMATLGAAGFMMFWCFGFFGGIAGAVAAAEAEAIAGGAVLSWTAAFAGGLPIWGNDSKKSFRMLQKSKYDSLHVKGFNTGPEYVVFNRDQVEIIKVVKM